MSDAPDAPFKVASYPVSAAPMMEITNRHCRYFWRLLSRHIPLYTEMVVSKALLHGDPHRFLDFNAAESPVILQLGGDDPGELAQCAVLARDWGYDEVNLNVGCPSSRVQSGNFGACLMHQPDLVADCVQAMTEASGMAVSVKHRLGTNETQGFDQLVSFVDKVQKAGCQRFIVHARIAILGGLSPKQNREVPPLDYEQVLQLKQEFPNLLIELNGGVTSWLQVAKALEQGFDGVMLGRALDANPTMLLEADQFFTGGENSQTLAFALQEYSTYMQQELQENPNSLRRLLAPLMNCFQGQPGAKSWRRRLTELPQAQVSIDQICSEVSAGLNSIDNVYKP